jgi:predicted Zn-ribbon and HTH transcriptional regulator
MKNPLASEKGLSIFVGLLFATGAMCRKCGYGTRRTSKRWARCKKCGLRVERIPLSDIRVEKVGS